MSEAAVKRILHVGCGGDTLPPWLPNIGGEETRLDIDPASGADIIASMTDMGEIGEYDTLYCSHALEHLYPHEVEVALSEFHRVLAPGGVAVVIVPDLEDIRPTEDVVMITPAGPVTGLDMIFGYRPRLAEMPHMAHHTGFVSSTLQAAFESSGFAKTITTRLSAFNLMAVAVKE